MSELVPVVATFLKGKPSPPLPCPLRLAHPAPTRAAAVFDMKHIVAISDALSEIVENTVEGGMNAPRRLSPRASSAPSAPWNPTAAQSSIVGEDFEEDGVDWRVLTVELDAGLEAVVVWYYNVDMAADANLTEGGMLLARTEGVDLDPLEWSKSGAGTLVLPDGGSGGAAKVAGRARQIR